MPEAEALARLHAACFTTPRPWSADEFTALLASPMVFLCAESGGFLIGRVVADEAELLTLAVDPALRRQGIGARLVHDFVETAFRRGAARCFLEVAADNDAALSLYLRCGFAEDGRRKAYYRSPRGQTVDAMVMSKTPVPRS